MESNLVPKCIPYA